MSIRKMYDLYKKCINDKCFFKFIKSDYDLTIIFEAAKKLALEVTPENYTLVERDYFIHSDSFNVCKKMVKLAAEKKLPEVKNLTALAYNINRIYVRQVGQMMINTDKIYVPNELDQLDQHDQHDQHDQLDQHDQHDVWKREKNLNYKEKKK